MTSRRNGLGSDFKTLLNDRKDYSDKEINSDLILIVNVLKDILLYIVLLIPNILLLIISFFSSKQDEKANYFEKVFLEPFRILMIIFNWFFEAPVTAYLIFFLVFMYFFEVFYLISFPDLMNMLMTHQNHLFEGNYYSVFTSIFLHANWLHLVTNCLALLIFGRQVEKEFRFKTLFIFLASGIISNVISNLISYYQGNFFYSLGASGAIAGLIIFAILLNPLSFTSFFIVPIPIFLLGWILILIDILGITRNSTTNHLAHLGGYSALLVLFFFLEIKNRKKIITGFTLNLVLLLVVYIISKFYDITQFISYLV